MARPKGEPLPEDRWGSEFTAAAWLESHVDQPPSRQQRVVFSTMVSNLYRAKHGRTSYFARVEDVHDYRTVYLPEDEPLLVDALERLTGYRYEPQRKRGKPTGFSPDQFQIRANGSGTYDACFQGGIVASRFLTVVDAQAWLNASGLVRYEPGLDVRKEQSNG